EHVYVVEVTNELSPDATERDAVCGPTVQWNGGGTYNAATVDPNIGPDVSDDDCVDLPDPEISITKTALAGPNTANGTEYTQAYTIEVTHSGEGQGQYSVTV